MFILTIYFLRTKYLYRTSKIDNCQSYPFPLFLSAGLPAALFLFPGAVLHGEQPGFHALPQNLAPGDLLGVGQPVNVLSLNLS